MTELNKDTVIEYGLVVSNGDWLIDVGETTLGSFIEHNKDDVNVVIDVIASLAHNNEPIVGGGAQPMFLIRRKTPHPSQRI